MQGLPRRKPEAEEASLPNEEFLKASFEDTGSVKEVFDKASDLADFTTGKELILDPEVLLWEKSLLRFNPDTDILVIPENDDDFVEKSLTSVVVMTAVDLASSSGALITIEGVRRPAIIRSWARSGSSELL